MLVGRPCVCMCITGTHQQSGATGAIQPPLSPLTHHLALTSHARPHLLHIATHRMVSATAWTLFVLISALNINLVVQSVRDGSFGGFSTRRLF